MTDPRRYTHLHDEADPDGVNPFGGKGVDDQARRMRAEQGRRGDGLIDVGVLPFKRQLNREIDRQLKGGAGNRYTTPRDQWNDDRYATGGSVNPFEARRKARARRYEDGGAVDGQRMLHPRRKRLEMQGPVYTETAPGEYTMNLRSAENWKNKFDERGHQYGDMRSRNPFEGRRSPATYAEGGRYRDEGEEHARGGNVPGFFLGGLFSSTPGTSSSNQTTNSSSNTEYDSSTQNNLDPFYWGLEQQYLQRASDLSTQTPFNRYPTDDRFAPWTKDQHLGMWNARENMGNWEPDTDQARSMYGQARDAFSGAGGIDSQAAAQPYLTRAGNGPTGTGAASNYLMRAGATWPGAMSTYMSPYTESVVNRIGDLGERNLQEKILPHVNDVFTGASFGRSRHEDFTNRAVRDTGESILGQQSEALERGYGTAANIFGQDMGRLAGLGQTAGSLAIGDTNAGANLAGTASSIADRQKASEIARGTAVGNAGTNFANLGAQTQALAGRDTSAIMASGNHQQAYDQGKKDFDYTQFQNIQQYPFAMNDVLGNSIRGVPVPTSSTSSGSSNTTGTSTMTGTSTATQPGGSPFGQILGAGLGLASLAIPGAGGPSALGNIFSGAFKADGGPVPGYDVGGYVPTVDQMRQHTAMAHPQPPQQGMMPTGMPGMPPMPSLVPGRPQPNGQPGGMPFAEGGSVPGVPNPNADLDALWAFVSGRPPMSAPPVAPQMFNPFDGSANGATGNVSGTIGMGDVGVGGTGGVGGSSGIGGESTGGSAAAGVGGDDGGTYGRGGDVDCFSRRKGPLEIITKLNFRRGGYYTPFGMVE